MHTCIYEVLIEGPKNEIKHQLKFSLELQPPFYGFISAAEWLFSETRNGNNQISLSQDDGSPTLQN